MDLKWASRSTSIGLTMTVGSKTAYLNNRRTTLPVVPVLMDGSTMVPLRFIGEALGAKVTWNDGHILYELGDTAISLQVGSLEARINGAASTLTVAPQVVGGSTLVPLRFVSTALGATLGWDGTTQTITITAAAP